MELIHPPTGSSARSGPGARWSRVLAIAPFAIMTALLAVYLHSILDGRLTLGGFGDIGSRFLIATEYARSPGHFLTLQPWYGEMVSWLSVWPPTPFLFQAAALRLALAPGASDVAAGIVAVQLTTIVVLLAAFYFVGRAVAEQTDAFTGLLAFLLCFTAPIALALAHTTMSEPYALFFVALGTWQVFRYLRTGRGIVFATIAFGLAFLSRNETILVAGIGGLVLAGAGRWRAAIGSVGSLIALVATKLVAAIVLVDGTRFYEFGKRYVDSPGGLDRGLGVVRTLVSESSGILVVAGVCALPVLGFAIAGRGSDATPTCATILAPGPQIDRQTPPLDALRALAKWFATTPVAFWAAALAALLGLLVLEVTRGSIYNQIRYLYLADVCMTTVIALLAARGIRFLRASASRLGKACGGAVGALLVGFGLASGFAHASGRTPTWTTLSPAQNGLVTYLRAHREPHDRIAFDFLGYDNMINLAAQLMDPSLPARGQFAEDFQTEFEGGSAEIRAKRLARVHAFVRDERPRFLVIASPALFETLAGFSDRGEVVDRIRGYLVPVAGDDDVLAFRSSWVPPQADLRYRRAYQNEDFVLVERQDPSRPTARPDAPNSPAGARARGG